VVISCAKLLKKGDFFKWRYLGFVGQGVLILLKMTKNVIGLIGSVNYLTPSKVEL
jgi:hypothetical protein